MTQIKKKLNNHIIKRDIKLYENFIIDIKRWRESKHLDKNAKILEQAYLELINECKEELIRNNL